MDPVILFILPDRPPPKGSSRETCLAQQAHIKLDKPINSIKYGVALLWGNCMRLLTTGAKDCGGGGNFFKTCRDFGRRGGVRASGGFFLSQEGAGWCVSR